MKLWHCLLITIFFKLSLALTPYELQVKFFVDRASERYYSLYNNMTAETYASVGEEDFETTFMRVTTVKTIAHELVEISKEAKQFNETKIHSENLKRALNVLRGVGGLFVLGDEYFESFLIAVNALHSLSTDKDIQPYMGGMNMPNHDNSPIAFYPDIQRIYETSEDADELKYYWKTWRDKNGIWAAVNCFTIKDAIQRSAKMLERPVIDFYYQGLEIDDLLSDMDKVMKELKPVYQQWHAFIRHELVKKYGREVVAVDGPIPDHLNQQVIYQAWKEGGIIEKYFPLKDLPIYDDFVHEFNGRQLLHKAQDFYASLGFPALEEDFTQNRLKQQEATASSEDCRANIFDMTPMVRMEYCQKVDFKKFMQMHGYLGRIHYAQSKKNLPSHFFAAYGLEYAVGEAVILSASTPKHLMAIGLAKDFAFGEKTLMNRLLRMGIHTLLNIPIYYVHIRVMNEFLNGSIKTDRINKRYWSLMGEYAGVEPPVDRGEISLDFPYKFYLDLEANHQTKKFISEILGYQFYKAFCQMSGHVHALHNCDFFGNKHVGKTLKSMMSLGSTRLWPEVISQVLTDTTHLSADAILDYYQPITEWIRGLNQQNHVKIGWSESKRKIP